MATRKGAWAKFPHDQKAFDFSGDRLKKAWPALHAGDLEPFPDDRRAAGLLKAAGKAAPKGVDPEALAARLQEAWRAFHRGDFQQAFDTGAALGALGASVAVKAAGIHATYLVDDDKERLARFTQAVEIADAAKSALPTEINSHYRHAFALGRYSQQLSIAQALKQGLAGKVRDSLERALAVDDRHAEAHTAMALFHAEIIGKVGALLGGVTYGAKATEANRHIQAALRLTPSSPIAHLEHGNILLLLHGDRQEDAAASAYEKSARLTPRDAMERLDGEQARSLIE